MGILCACCELQAGCCQIPVFHQAGLRAAVLSSPSNGTDSVLTRSSGMRGWSFLAVSWNWSSKQPEQWEPSLALAAHGSWGELLCRCKNQFGKLLFMLDTGFSKLFCSELQLHVPRGSCIVSASFSLGLDALKGCRT